MGEKSKKDGEEKMDVDTEKKDEKKEKMEVDEKKEEDKTEKKEPEPLFEMLSNPARVMKAQLKVINLEDGRYKPMKGLSIGGIVLLDNTSGEAEEIVDPMEVNKATSTADKDGEEPSPPEPFEWNEED